MQAGVLLLVLILPVAALVRRRLPIGTLLKYTAAWLLIAAVLYGIIPVFT